MLLVIFINYIILLSIFGYSVYLKKYLTEEGPYLEVHNADFFYGLLFVIFLSIFLNFFFPLKYFTIPIISLGVILFLIGFKKNYFKINLLFYFLIIFLISFIALYGRDNVDSPMYHLQIIKWLTLHKINFGLANLEIRFGFNSSWHSFISLYNVTFEKFSSKFYISAVIFSFTIYEALKPKVKIYPSDIFLYLFFCYLFLFSFLHPFNYGVILNHIGNPERDIASMFIYVFSFYIFIKIFEEKDFTQNKKNLINLLVITSFICVTTRLTTLLVLLLPLFVFYKNSQFKILNSRTNIFVIIIGLLWMLRSFILSGCFVFPIQQTCIDTTWAVNPETLNFMVDEAKRFTRTLPYLNRVDDFNYTLMSYDWVGPWIKDYLFKTALLQINLSIISFVLLFSFFKFIILKNKNISSFKICQNEIFILAVLFLSFLLWMIAPETRYAWGLHFVIPCFLIIIFFKNNLIRYLDKINYKFLLCNFFIIFLLFFTKSFSFFVIDDFFSIPSRDYAHSDKIKIGQFDNTSIYHSWSKCADFKEICVHTQKINFTLHNKYSYTIFTNN